MNANAAEGAVSLSVFFPCYNEETNVANTVSKAVEVLDGMGADYEIIIVDDGSKDRTGEIADELAAKNERVKVVHHEVNSGYGSALQSGFKSTSKELVFYTDGDGQFDIGELPSVVELIGDCDIVSCYRLKRQDNLLRKINGWCWSHLVCLLFWFRVRDVDCAFKLYRRKIFDDIRMCSKGALIDTEILARASRKGYRIAQKGVHHYPRTSGEQTGANIRVILRAFAELFRLWRQIRSGN